MLLIAPSLPMKNCRPTKTFPPLGLDRAASTMTSVQSSGFTTG
jgi:hypothetical protein